MGYAFTVPVNSQNKEGLATVLAADLKIAAVAGFGAFDESIDRRYGVILLTYGRTSTALS